MKKVFVLFSTVLVAFSLSACDLVPEEVVELSEEYCRENPDDEICQGESLEDLDDEFVLNVYNRIVNEYDDETIDTFCDDYISITNTNLLDQCREDRSVFFPENFTNFTVNDVSRKNSLSTQDVYEIIATSSDMTRIVTFTVGLVGVDGITYINAWSFDEQTQNPQEIDVPAEDAEAHFKQFITDWVDDTLDSTAVCEEYLPTTEVDGCINDRDNSDLTQVSIEVIDFTLQTDGTFEATLSIKDTAASTPEEQTLILSFSYTQYGVIKIIMTEAEDNNEPDTEVYVIGEDARSILDDFIADYLDSSVTDEYLNQTYFNGMMDADFFLDRQTDFEKGVTLSVGAITTPTDYPADEYVLVEITRVENESTETVEIPISVYITADNNYILDLVFPDYTGEIDAATLEDFLDKVFTDYMDGTLTSDTVCNMYFVPEAVVNCIQNRDMQLENNVFVTLENIYLEDGMFFIQIQIDNGEILINETQRIEVYYDNNNELKLLVHDDNEGNMVPFNEADAFIHKLFIDYIDDSITTIDFCTMYFEYEMVDGCLESRDEQLTDGWNISLIDFYLEESQYFMTIRVDDGVEIMEDTQAVDIYYNELNDLKIYVYDSQDMMVDFETAQSFITQLFIDYMDDSLQDEAVCSVYFSEDMMDDCYENRQDQLASGATITLNDFFEKDGLYFIEIKFDDGISLDYETQEVMVYYNENGDLKAHFIDDYQSDVLMEDADNHLQAFVAAFNDTSITNTDVCSLYISPEAQEWCLAYRDHIFTSSLFITQAILNYEGNGGYFIEFIIDNGTETYSDFVNAFFYYDEYSDLYMATFSNYEPQPISLEEAQAFFTNFELQFNDSNLGAEAVCNNFFDEETSLGCIEKRNDVMTNNLTVKVISVWSYEGYFQVELSFEDETGNEVENDIINVFFFFNEANELKAKFGDDNYNVDYEVALEYVHALMKDFVDETMSIQQFCELHFPWDNSGDCFLNRSEYDLTILEWTFIRLEKQFGEEEWYEFEFKLINTASSEEWIEILPVNFFFDESGALWMNLNWMASWDLLSPTEAEDVIYQFVADYQDDTLSNDFINEQYFDYRMDGEFYTNRDNDLLNETTITVLSIIPPEIGDMEGYIEVTLEVNDGINTMTQTVYMRVYMINESRYLIEMQDEKPYELDYGQAEAIINTYVAEFNDPSLTNDDVCQAYFNNESIDECYANRNSASMNGEVLSLNGFWEENGEYFAEFVYIDEISNNVWSETVRVNFYTSENEKIYMAFEHKPMQEKIDYDSAYNVIMIMVEEFNDSAMSSSDFCSFYPNMFTDCVTFRDAFLSNGGAIYIVNFNEMDNIAFRLDIEIHPGDSSPVYNVAYETSFYYDENETLQFDIWTIIDEFQYTSFGDAQTIFTQFITDYLDPNYTNQDIADMYFNGYIDPMFEETRNADVADGVTLVDIIFTDPSNMNGVDFIQATITWIKNDTAIDLIQHFRVLEFLDNSHMIEMKHQDPNNGPQIDYDTAYAHIEGMLNDFTDSNISDEDFCAMYYPYDGSSCAVSRQEFNIMYSSVSVESFVFDNQMFTYILTVELFDHNSTVVNTMSYYTDFWWNEDNMLETYMIEVNELSWDQLNMVTNELDLMLNQFMDSSVSVDSYCTMYYPNDTECQIMKNEQLQGNINDAYVIDFWMENLLFSDANYHARIHYVFTNSAYETHYLTVNINTDSTGNLSITLLTVGREISVPADGVFQEYSSTESILQQFAADYADSTVTNQQLCDLYFGGVLNPDICGGDRQSILDSNATVSLISLAEQTDEFGEPYFIATFEFNFGTSTETQVGYFRVYTLANSNYFIEFLED